MMSTEITPMAPRESLTIGQLARQTGVSAKAIRYYESIGLLPRPPRGPNTYRRYSSADVTRVILLRRIRLLGAPLSSAKALMNGASDARCAEVRDELLSLVHERLAAIDLEIAELHKLRDGVARYQRALSACQPNASELFSACIDASCLAPSGGVCCEEQSDAESC